MLANNLPEQILLALSVAFRAGFAVWATLLTITILHDQNWPRDDLSRTLVAFFALLAIFFAWNSTLILVYAGFNIFILILDNITNCGLAIAITAFTYNLWLKNDE